MTAVGVDVDTPDVQARRPSVAAGQISGSINNQAQGVDAVDPGRAAALRRVAHQVWVHSRQTRMYEQKVERLVDAAADVLGGGGFAGTPADAIDALRHAVCEMRRWNQ